MPKAAYAQNGGFMIYVAYLILLFTFLQLLIAVVNVLFKEELPKEGSNFEGMVSVLIPARNEAQNIGPLLNDLIHQDYRHIEILVFNDQSEDQTASVVEQLAQTDDRIKLINSDGLPNGWLGKNFACHSLSKHAQGEYFLFLDADVSIQGSIIKDAVVFVQKYKLGLLSIFPKQILKSVGEKITVPLMNYILLSLLPLVFVRKSGLSSLAAANGQFMLFETSVYKQYLPHEFMKNNKVEDIAIARFYKQHHFSIACLTGDENIQCRMYDGFWNAIHGFSKNITAFFGNSFVLSVLFWAITTFGFMVVLFEVPFGIFIAYLLVILIIRILTSRVSKQDTFESLLYFIPQQLSCGLILFKSVIYKYIYKYQWKNRSLD
jgi:glycosyltransferase involved in cell wall biosynthesis